MGPQRYSEDLAVFSAGLEHGVDHSGALGLLAVFGPTAFPMLVGTYGHDASRQPIAAASRFGEGKVVGFAHDCFVYPKSEAQKTLLENCVKWVTMGESLAAGKTCVGLLSSNAELDAWGRNFKVTPLSGEDVTREGLGKVDVLILVDHELMDTPHKVNIVKSFVRRGGGLLTAATGWAFKREIDQHPLNQICYEAGFGWTKNYNITPVEPNSKLFSFNVDQLQDTHGGDAWKILQAKYETNFEFSESRMKQMNSVLELAKSNLPPRHPLLEAIEKKQPVHPHVEDLKTLLAGLECGVVKPGTIGVMSVYGPNAFTVLSGKYNDDTRHAVGAAARYGDGKMVGFGHGGFTCPTEESLRQLLTNSVRWAAPESAQKQIRVGLVYPSTSFNDWRAENEKNFHFVEFYDSGKLTEKLGELDVILLEYVYYLSDVTHLQLVKRFVRNGGGFVTAATAWAYDKNIKTEHPGNLLTRDAGFAWTPTYALNPIEDGATVFSTALPNLSDTHAGTAWALFYGAMNNELTLPPERLAQLGSVMNFALDVAAVSVPTTFTALVQKDLEKFAEVIPSESCVITNPLDKFKLKYQVDFIYNGDAKKDKGKCACHPATRFFPGLTTPPAPREANHPFKITAKDAAWYSTGVYAPPGEEITLKLSKAMTQRISLQIGCHSDDISTKDKWYRCPVLIVRKELVPGATELQMSNTFGGLVYVVTNEDDAAAFAIEGALSGVILAPHFILGTTTLAEWAEIRKRGTSVPWGELETNKIILTLPGPKLAALADPVALMNLWNECVYAQEDLAGVERTRAERMIADLQISRGYMHAGYPIMIWTDVSVDVALSTADLRGRPAWGHFHELGHNLQVSAWNFDYVGETSNNVFALYVYTEVARITFAQARPDTFEAESMKTAIESYAKKGADYRAWDDDPFTGLLFYAQLQAKYGWEAYKKVFRSYQALSTQPHTQQDKIDRWLIQFSTIVGENLAPLFKAWGIPISDEAGNSLSNLPPTDQTLFSLVQN